MKVRLERPNNSLQVLQQLPRRADLGFLPKNLGVRWHFVFAVLRVEPKNLWMGGKTAVPLNSSLLSPSKQIITMIILSLASKGKKNYLLEQVPG